MPQLKVIISGGGTGGHIFPAIAIANALKKLVPAVKILFVGAKGRMEMEKVPAAGYDIKGLWISGFQRRLTISNLSFPFKIIHSWFRARRILKTFKPDVVIGTGGYASGPMVRVAASAGIPTIIQEQNSYAGITNRLLGKKVSRVCVAYEGMERFFPKEKIMLTGNPVRSDIQNLEGKASRGYEFFSLDPSHKTLLVLGGSLGARTINQAVLKSLKAFDQAGIQLVWQTGKNYFSEINEQVAASGYTRFRVYDFINRMDLAYAVADLVISRAGASSVSELCIVKMPAILIPSPNVAEDHQTRNAEALVNHHAAVLVKDEDAASQLEPAVTSLLQHEDELRRLSSNIAALAFTDAAARIASEVLNLAGRRAS